MSTFPALAISVSLSSTKLAANRLASFLSCPVSRLNDQSTAILSNFDNNRRVDLQSNGSQDLYRERMS
jgi:hypothetical protein